MLPNLQYLLSSGSTDKTRPVKKNDMTIIIGAAIGGLVIVLIVIIIVIIVLICFCLAKGKSKQLSYDLPGNEYV